MSNLTLSNKHHVNKAENSDDIMNNPFHLMKGKILGIDEECSKNLIQSGNMNRLHTCKILFILFGKKKNMKKPG